MTAPIVRVDGTALTPVAFSAIASGTAPPGYSSSPMRVQMSALSTPGLLVADFRITSITWGGTPTGGAISLFAVDRDFSGTQGPTPGTNYAPRFIGSFSPTETTSSSPGVLALNQVALSFDADYYVGNVGTGQTFAGTLNCKPWSPGA